LRRLFLKGGEVAAEAAAAPTTAPTTRSTGMTSHPHSGTRSAPGRHNRICQYEKIILPGLKPVVSKEMGNVKKVWLKRSRRFTEAFFSAKNASVKRRE
jgi:hypothetical protein